MKVRSILRPRNIEIMGDQVFIASNIIPYEETIEGHVRTGYEFDCEKYTKDEYIIKLAQENEQLKQDIIDTQLALVELYEAGDTL